MKETNWAGNLTYHAAALHRPTTVEEVQELVARSPKLKALGSRHSFNDVADTTGELISPEHLNQVQVAPDRQSVRIGAGVRYGELAGVLQREGLALHNLASLPHISVAGGVATATHGSGDNNSCLAVAVRGLELVRADGEQVQLTRESPEFAGAVVGLGGLGVVTGLSLAVEPSYQVRQDVYEGLSLASLEANFEAITGSAYSLSLFTDWQEPRFRLAWLKSRVGDGGEPGPEFFGARRASVPQHPLEGHSAQSATEQLGIPGPWHLRLPHFRLEHTPSLGEELQTEYLVPREHALEALHALYALRGEMAQVILVCEVRTVAGDELWMSPFYQQPCVGLHFTWVKRWEAVKALLPLMEKKLEPFAARPHWGKLFTLAPEKLPMLYPKLPEFRRLLQSFDPEGKFRNTFLDTYIFGLE